MCLNVLVTQMHIKNKKNRMTPEYYLSLALDPPDKKAIRSSLITLEEVGAITYINSDDNKKQNYNDYNEEKVHEKSEENDCVIGNIKIEPLGILLSKIPTDVKISKFQFTVILLFFEGDSLKIFCFEGKILIMGCYYSIKRHSH